jgi:hypothetical protein
MEKWRIFGPWDVPWDTIQRYSEWVVDGKPGKPNRVQGYNLSFQLEISNF